MRCGQATSLFCVASRIFPWCERYRLGASERIRGCGFGFIHVPDEIVRLAWSLESRTNPMPAARMSRGASRCLPAHPRRSQRPGPARSELFFAGFGQRNALAQLAAWTPDCDGLSTATGRWCCSVTISTPCCTSARTAWRSRATSASLICTVAIVPIMARPMAFVLFGSVLKAGRFTREDLARIICSRVVQKARHSIRMGSSATSPAREPEPSEDRLMITC